MLFHGIEPILNFLFVDTISKFDMGLLRIRKPTIVHMVSTNFYIKIAICHTKSMKLRSLTKNTSILHIKYNSKSISNWNFEYEFKVLSFHLACNAKKFHFFLVSKLLKYLHI